MKRRVWTFLYLVCFLAVLGKSETNTTPNQSIAIVITVKTPLTILRNCLASLQRNSPHSIKQSIVLVDDGSPIEVQKYMDQLVKEHGELFSLMQTPPDKRGYTRATNAAIRSILSWKSPPYAIVLLNSDVVVTKGWAEEMIRAMRTSNASFIGPMSNAATFQSAPKIHDPKGGWSTNKLPLGLDPEVIARAVYTAGSSQLVPFPILNGFCVMYKASLFSEFGLFDEEAFPVGYGEEVDFFLRAGAAGYSGGVASRVFIHHEKTASFSIEDRHSLKVSAAKVLSRRHPSLPKLNLLGASIPLRPVREAVALVYAEYRDLFRFPTGKRILFVLDGILLRGGIISIVGESWRMHSYGISVRVAVPCNAPIHLIDTIFPGASQIFVCYNGDIFNHALSDSFVNVANKSDILIASVWSSVRTITIAKQLIPRLRLFYYVQDYEPWFYEDKNHGVTHANFHKSSSASYNAEGIELMAKTDWLVETVWKFHKVPVHRVVPSVDRAVFFPYVTTQMKKWSRPQVVVAAMLREETPRRNARATVVLACMLKREYGERVAIQLFGDSKDTWNAPERQIRECEGVINSLQFLGSVGSRDHMSSVFNNADIFLDVSWWQAFGRSAVESMATGCVAVMPNIGAGNEICNSPVGKTPACATADPHNISDYFAVTKRLVDSPQMRREMSEAAIERVAGFTLDNAAASILKVLGSGQAK